MKFTITRPNMRGFWVIEADTPKHAVLTAIDYLVPTDWAVCDDLSTDPLKKVWRVWRKANACESFLVRASFADWLDSIEEKRTTKSLL